MAFNVYNANGQMVLQNQPSSFTISNLEPNKTYTNYKVEDTNTGKTITLKPFMTSTKPATSVSADVSEMNLSLSSNNQGTINITYAPEDTTDTVKFTSGDLNIATVSDEGVITAKNVGNTYITVLLGAQSTSVKVNVAN